MSDVTRGAVGGGARRVWPLVALAANLFALATVGFWIFAARARYIAANPEETANKPPTISGAIADPAIGEPFAFWVTVSAVLLLFGVFFNAQFYRQLPRAVPDLRGGLKTWFHIMPLIVLALQALAGVGMYILSNFRFPDHRDAHMMGSYIFFTSQALVVVFGAVLCHIVLRDRASLADLANRRLLSPRALKIRRGLGIVSFGSVLLYLILFIIKDINLAPLNEEIYWLYTSTEPTLIAIFLVFLGLFQTDLLVLRRL